MSIADVRGAAYAFARADQSGLEAGAFGLETTDVFGVGAAADGAEAFGPAAFGAAGAGEAASGAGGLEISGLSVPVADKSLEELPLRK